MKIIAWHLPQFHETEENNRWWGKGFTEWTNTQKAKPLFEGHIQPKEPLNDNYYNLLEKKTMEWQLKISKENEIYGFCYYHYWFKGKQLLEKPVENLLEWKDIDQKFCFSWANEPWARTWDGRNTDILMRQEYGKKEDWKKHFDYLKKFFKDERYIKENGKPLFLIYKTWSIPECEKMISYWNELAINEGFNGMYIVETLNGTQLESKCKSSEAVVYMEPMFTFKEQKTIKRIYNKLLRYIVKPQRYSYDNIWKKIIKRNYSRVDKKNIFLGSFVSWDNTARKGDKGIVMEGTTPEKFEKYMKLQKENLKKMDQKYIFINAWNEWAEGTYLEPDKKNGYQYLDVIKKIMKSK